MESRARSLSLAEGCRDSDQKPEQGPHGGAHRPAGSAGPEPTQSCKGSPGGRPSHQPSALVAFLISPLPSLILRDSTSLNKKQWT